MSYVQSNGNAANPATSLAVALSTNVAVGDLIVVSYRGTDTAPGISDSLGNTYSLLSGDGGAYSFRMAQCVVTTAGACTVTVTQSSGRCGVNVHHYSGMDSTPLDAETVVANLTGVTATATAAFSTSVANGVAVGMWGGSVTPTPEANYGGANLQGNGTGRLFTCHRLFTSTLSSETVDWTHTSANPQAKAAAFKEATGGATERHQTRRTIQAGGFF